MQVFTSPFMGSPDGSPGGWGMPPGGMLPPHGAGAANPRVPRGNRRSHLGQRSATAPVMGSEAQFFQGPIPGPHQHVMLGPAGMSYSADMGDAAAAAAAALPHHQQQQRGSAVAPQHAVFEQPAGQLPQQLQPASEGAESLEMGPDGQPMKLNARYACASGDHSPPEHDGCP